MKFASSLLAIAATVLTVAASAPASATIFTYSGAGGNILDGVNTRTSITVTDSFSIADIDLFVDGLTHSFPADVQMYLERGGTSLRLLLNNGPNRNGSFGTLGLGFDDEAATSITAYVSGNPGPYRPIDALSMLDGTNSAGLWTLRVTDTVGGDSGSYTGWRLQLNDGAAAPGAVPEPATWAAMVVGFGLVGGAARRRRRVAVTA